MNVFLEKEIASSYDQYYQSEAGKAIDKIEKELVFELIKNVPRSEMLELGCGTGHWTAFFEENGFDLTALDTSEEMLKFAKNRNLKAKFIKANSENLKFTHQSFAFVSSITMLEFVENQQKVIDEAYRVLKPGGYLLLGQLLEGSVIAKHKDNSETFKNAIFLSEEKLKNLLSKFGNLKFNTGVYQNSNFEITDNKENKGDSNPTFITVLAQKF